MANILDTNRQIVEAIRNLAFSACCPDIPIAEQPKQDTDILPGVGDPPATWGDEPVTDWEDWERLVCGYANGWVDRQISNANLVQTLITTGTLTVALIVGIMFVIGLTVISMGTAAGIWGGLGALYGTFVFSAAATAFTENRDAIICKILSDEGVGEFRNYMQSIIPPLAWAGFYTWLDYQHIINSIWEGRNPDGTLDVMRVNCPDCQDPTIYDFDIYSTRQSPGVAWNLFRADGNDIPEWWNHYPRNRTGSTYGNSQQNLSRTAIISHLGLEPGIIPHLTRIDLYVLAGTNWEPYTLRLDWYNAAGQAQHVFPTMVNGLGQDITVTLDIDSGQSGGWTFRVLGLHNGGPDRNDANCRAHVQWVRLRGVLVAQE